MDTTRRRFVRAGGLAAVLGTTGLAGCSGILGGGGSSAGGGWQYNPRALAETPNVMFGSMNYGELYSMREDLPDSMQQDFEIEQQGDSPVSPGDLDQMVGVGGGDISQDMQSTSFFGSLAVTGSFDRQAVVDQVESEGEATSAGDYEGYALYEVPELSDAPVGGGGMGQQVQGSGTVAIGDSAMVVGAGIAQNSDLGVGGTAAVETMIDAEAGNAERLSATSGPAQDLQSRISDKLMTVGAEVDPELVEFAQTMYGGGGGQGGAGTMLAGLRAGGLGADINPDTTTYNFVLIYDSASSAEEAGLADMIDGMSSRFEQQPGIESVSGTQDGSAVIAEISGDTKTLLEQGQQAGGTFNVRPPSP